MSLKNLLKWIKSYSLEIVMSPVAVAFLFGLLAAINRQHCADNIPLTDFQTVQLCTYSIFLMLGVITMTNAAQARATAKGNHNDRFWVTLLEERKNGFEDDTTYSGKYVKSIIQGAISRMK